MHMEEEKQRNTSAGVWILFFHWAAAAAAKRLCRRARNVSRDPRVNRDSVVKRKSGVWSGPRLSYVQGFVQLPFTFLVSPQPCKKNTTKKKTSSCSLAVKDVWN